MTTTLRSWIDKLAGQRIVVIGDVILDEYLIGVATRMSREAPIPVLEFTSRQLIPGGAANPAANITALGSSAVQIAVIGADSSADALRAAMEARAIDTRAMIADPERPTTQKTRVLAQMGLRFPQQVARLDTLSRAPLSETTTAALQAQIPHVLTGAHAILCSDYQLGLLTPALIRLLAQHRREYCPDALLTADAQGNFEKYVGFDLIKCNADEARAFLRRNLQGDADFAAAAEEMLITLQLQRGMAITRGSDGMTFAVPGKPAEHVQAPSISDVFDTVGAGDTAIAVMTLALSAGASMAEAASLANYASGIVVRRVGNYSPSPAELYAALPG